jgi:hypothetical protein
MQAQPATQSVYRPARIHDGRSVGLFESKTCGGTFTKCMLWFQNTKSGVVATPFRYCSRQILGRWAAPDRRAAFPRTRESTSGACQISPARNPPSLYSGGDI